MNIIFRKLKSLFSSKCKIITGQDFNDLLIKWMSESDVTPDSKSISEAEHRYRHGQSTKLVNVQ